MKLLTKEQANVKINMLKTKIIVKLGTLVIK